jgi:hypothetical protein
LEKLDLRDREEKNGKKRFEIMKELDAGCLHSVHVILGIKFN